MRCITRLSQAPFEAPCRAHRPALTHTRSIIYRPSLGAQARRSPRGRLYVIVACAGMGRIRFSVSFHRNHLFASP